MLANEVARAAQWVERYIAERAARIDDALAKGGFGPGKRSAAIDEALAILRGDAPIQLQQPTSLYFPGLAATPLLSSGRSLPGSDRFEARTGSIKAELERAAPVAGGGVRALCRRRRRSIGRHGAQCPSCGRRQLECLSPPEGRRAGRRPCRPFPRDTGGARAGPAATCVWAVADGAFFLAEARRPYPAAPWPVQFPADLPPAADRPARLHASRRQSAAPVARRRTADLRRQHGA